MNLAAPTLLAHLDAPVVVADPDGKTVFTNPAFESRFRVALAEVRGTPLAMLFEGGGREAVLGATARTCESGRSVRFRVRERGVGYGALASPIVVEGAAVGVILLLVEEALEEERLLAFHREIAQPVEELGRCLEELFEQTGGRRSGRFRDQVEFGLRSLERLRRWTEELHAAVTGRPARSSGSSRFDPVEVVRSAAAGVAEEAAAAGRELELLVPAQLPAGAGDGARLEAALASLLRARFERSSSPSFTLAAKAVGQGERAAILISLSEAPVEGAAPDDDLDETPPIVADVVTSLGGSLRAADDPLLGRTTAIRLPLAG